MDIRKIAVKIGIQVNWERRRAAELLSETFDRYNILPRDRRFLSYLLLGSIRHRLTLDWLIRRFTRSRSLVLPPAVREAIRQGLFQALFMERVPTHSAVSETVQVVKSLSSKLVPFANAILRAITVSATHTTGTPLPPPLTGDYSSRQFDDSLLRRAIACVENRAIVFDRDVLPRPEEDFARFLGVAHSHPRWLVKRWLERFGEENTVKLLRHNNAIPIFRLRPNLTKISSGELRQKLVENGIEFTESGEDFLLTFPSAGLKFIVEGLARFQGSVAGKPALKAERGPVMELCAAPGGKTLQLVHRLGVVALDNCPERLKSMKVTLERANAHAHIICADARTVTNLLRRRFPTVLVDVPCSNTGVMAQRPEVRWRLKESQIHWLASLQLELLLAGLDIADSCGAVIYSTCSLEQAENEAVVRKALKLRPSFELQTEEFYLPHQTGEDGGYIAILRRKEV